MRWTTFGIIVVMLLTLQTTIAPLVQVFGARPDWLFVGVVYFAMYARPRDAVIAAWIIGFCADLMTIERMGLISFSYAISALGIISIRQYIFRYRALTQFTMTFCTCLLVQTVWLVYRRLMLPNAKSIVVDWSVGVLVVSLYTGLWAPLLHKLLLKLSKPLGISRPRYSHAGLHALETADV